MSSPTYDIVVIGAGSVGNPAALFLARRGLKVLVLDQGAAPGQGQNKAAIGGVRATHSDPAKISLGLRSIEHFSTFKDTYGIEVGWKEGGYCFPVFDDDVENLLKGLLPTQHHYGLDIDWHEPDSICEIVPGINERDLRGGTFSPGDGQVSPLMFADACWKVARRFGAEYRLRETVTGIDVRSGRVEAVITDKGRYATAAVLNAAGGDARRIGAMTRLEIPVVPDSHEAGISAPIKPFLDPLIVDLRPGPEGKTANFYFGQNSEAQIIFCYTPRDPIVGENRESTSEFLPVIARRLIDLIPAFEHLLIRRIWRGLYPMTPDGVPILGAVDGIEGMYLAVGMCGQGFMLGPGVGECMASLIADRTPTIDDDVFAELALSRDFIHAEVEGLK
ncbi:MAG: FAD-binding oxidoreductase [Planctomycetota bacterium]|nr:FAD-binding oxidoreductase [Planctomycetota bacterium]